MSLWNKNEIIQALSEQLIDFRIYDNLSIDEVVIDSRKATKDKLFIALKGEIHDAHTFLGQVFENGCHTVIIHDKSIFAELKDALSYKNTNVILVKDSFKALYKLASFSRNRSSAKIIAITGSVGKTSVKEMLKLALSAYGKTFATIGNFNNHIGLPLCLANFSKNCDYGIFEMGMNHLNEIEPLCRLTKPHLAIITNVGPVHIEFFKNEEEIALAKSEIFSGIENGGFALINADNQHFDFLKKRAEISGISSNNILSFGESDKSNYQIEKSEVEDVKTSKVFLKIEDSDKTSGKNCQNISYKIASSSKAIIFNSSIIIGALDIITNDINTGISKLINFVEEAGRGKAFEAIFDDKKIIIIDDSYNASLPSMKAGIEHGVKLKSALNKNRVIVALGDMLELGEKSLELHEEITNYLKELEIDFSILVGDKISLATKRLNNNTYKIFPNSESASLEIKDLLQDGDILYVKGSRGIKMEKIIHKITD